jgi:cell volume regulation protein A
LSLPEPGTTALLLLTIGLLLLAAVVLARASERLRVPVVLVFLTVGVLAGSEGIVGIEFEDYRLAFRVGAAALALILFDGGLNTPTGQLRSHLAPAGLLATIGVLGTAALLSLAARLVGFDWSTALLLGAVVSSTDAAAVFAMLRGSGVSLKRRVGLTLELESGLNDPTAVILVTLLTRNFMGPDVSRWWIPLEILQHLAIGLAGGLLFGYGGRWLLSRVRLTASGLYPVLTIALALLSFSTPTLLHGSGFLAVYVTGLIVGSGTVPYRASLVRVHDSVAWLGQAAMFLMLGLLVFPSRLLEVARVGMILAFFLALARPIVAVLCLAPFRFTVRQTGFIGWAGIRGAVPIILATIPVLSRVPGAERLFDLVFFMVVVNAIVPGSTIAWLARRLGLEADDPPAPPAVLDIESALPLSSRLLSFHVDEALAVTGSSIGELPLPEKTAVTLVIRGTELLPATAETVLTPGDHVVIVTPAEAEPLVRLMFGRPEGE